MDIVGGIQSLGNKALSGFQAYGSYQTGDYRSAAIHASRVMGGKAEEAVTKATDMYTNARSTVGMLGAGYHGFSGALRAA